MVRYLTRHLRGLALAGALFGAAAAPAWAPSLVPAASVLTLSPAAGISGAPRCALNPTTRQPAPELPTHAPTQPTKQGDPGNKPW